jgi:hypothetical protein
MIINYLKPMEAGLEKFLGPIEVSIMRAVWRGERTIPQIHARIIQADNVWAENTIRTVAIRLTRKGLLKRESPQFFPVFQSERHFILTVLVLSLKSIGEDFEEELELAIGEYFKRQVLGD